MDWRFSTFLLFLFALLIGFSWGTSQNGLCHSKFVVDILALQNKDGALNCFDFWLNRYQTLIGSLIALTAALLALLPARGQLREMRRQSSASARQSAIEQAKDLETEVAAYKAASPIHLSLTYRLEEFDDSKNWPNIYREWPEKWQDLIGRIAAIRDQASFYSGRYPVMDDVWLARLELRDTALRLSCGGRDIASIFRRSTTGPYYEYGEDDVTKEEADLARSNMDDAIAAFEDARKAVIAKLDRLLERTWQEVRSLEKNALGR